MGGSTVHKKICITMLKDVGIALPTIRETSAVYSKTGDCGMQQ